MAIYRELAGLPETEREFRAVGYAGQVIVYDRMGQSSQVQELLPVAMNLRADVDSEHGRVLDTIADRLRRNAGDS
jgi:hypothetical protein